MYEHKFEGENYTPMLSDKEIAGKIRTYLKEKYPTCRFSVTVGARVSSITVCLMSGPEEALENPSDGDITVSQYAVSEDERLTPWAKKIMEDVSKFSMSWNYDDSDIMTDYFNTNFYFFMGIGKFDRPYKVVKPRAKPTRSPKVTNIPGKVGDVKVVNNSERHGIELYFPEKPNAKVLEALKKSGFRWHHKKRCWYAAATQDRVDLLDRIVSTK